MYIDCKGIEEDILELLSHEAMPREAIITCLAEADNVEGSYVETILDHLITLRWVTETDGICTLTRQMP